MPGIDTASLTATLQNMKTSLETLQSAAGQMSTKLDGMQTKLATLSGVSIPEAPMTQLTTSVKVLIQACRDWMLQSTHLPEM